jgi:HAE1 family hydrophobic/amphiphilic exporter-1
MSREEQIQEPAAEAAAESEKPGFFRQLLGIGVYRPIATTMLLVSIVVFGGIAMQRLPLALLPEVDVPFIGIEVPFQSSNPLQVEREITKPIEEVLGTLSGIKRINSTSKPDGAEFQLEFDWGEDLDIVRMQVSEKIDQIKPQLPEGVQDILIFSFNTADIPVVQGRISADGVDLSQNYELLEARVINRLRRIPGVARVMLDGIEPRQIFIDIHLDKVKQLGVDMGGLIQTLRNSSQNLVLGEVESDGKRYTARAVGNFDSLESLRALLINERGLRLGDVADVLYEEPPIEFGRHLNHTQAIALNVFKESTANTVDVVNAVLAEINGEITKDPLLKGISLFMWQNQAEQITGSLDGLTEAGWQGALLAVLVLYFFLRRWGPTLVVSLSIPFSVIAACGMLYFLGKSLNMLSMMGLMLGIGMLVDNAIVVLEAIDRRRRVEKDAGAAALFGTRQVAMAVAASTMTSLIVFLPLIVGSKSELTVWLGEVGITISLAMVCSLFSALTLIPMLAGRALRGTEPVELPSITRLEGSYARLLGWTLQHKTKTFFLLMLGLGVGFAPFFAGWVDASTFSGAVNERLYLTYEFKDYNYKSDAEKAVTQVEQVFEQHKDELYIESIYSFFRANEAGTTLTLTRKDFDDEKMKELRQKARELLPEIAGVKITFESEEDQDTGATNFAMNLYGQDSEILSKLAAETQRRLETVKGVQDVRTSIGQTRKEIEVKVDRDKVARLGLDAQEVSDTFTFVLGAVPLPRFSNGQREVETSLALRLEDRSNLEDLREIPFRTIEGKPVTLGDVATFNTVDRAMEIERENRKVRVLIRAAYEGEDWDKTREELEGLMNAFSLPSGYSWSWGQRILEQDQQGSQMGVNFLLALALVYLVMAAVFESVTQPFAILFSIPFAIPGVAWLHAVTGSPFNLMSQIGILILMGVVVNNGIVLLDHMNDLRRHGMGRDEAIVQAGRDRLRAILMTAITTIIAMLPLVFGGSRVGGLFYYPLALTMIGGLLSSTILTLVVLPYINLGVESFALGCRRIWAAATGQLAPAEAELALEAAEPQAGGG